jgi:hypothetical protein
VATLDDGERSTAGDRIRELMISRRRRRWIVRRCRHWLRLLTAAPPPRPLNALSFRARRRSPQRRYAAIADTSSDLETLQYLTIPTDARR